MILRMARNMLIAARNQTPINLYTDPVPMGDNNQGDGIITVHQLEPHPSNTAEMAIYLETSNDGRNFATSGTPLTTVSSASTTSFSLGSINAAQMRLRFSFEPSTSGTDNGSAFCTFDLDIRLDRA